MHKVGNTYFEVGHAVAITFVNDTKLQIMFPGGVLIEDGTPEEVAAVRATVEHYRAAFPRFVEKADLDLEAAMEVHREDAAWKAKRTNS